MADLFLIYISEDAQDILNLEQALLEEAGYAVRGFENASSLLAGLCEQIPDLILLDQILPDGDGLHVCGKIRGNPVWEDIPVIFVTGRSEKEDLIRGLQFGADDYVTKPFLAEELLARVQAILRRSRRNKTRNLVTIAPGLRLDYQRNELVLTGERIPLTRSEFRILELLVARPDWAFRRSEILDHLWGDDKAVIERTVDVHIRNLREKLGEHANLIMKVHGVGYRFTPVNGGKTGDE